MSAQRKFSTTESLLLLASEDVQDFKTQFIPEESNETQPLLQSRSYPSSNQLDIEAAGTTVVDNQEEEEEVKEVSILKIPNIFAIETSLLLNVLLAAFDGTVTASTYTIIGSEFNAVHLGSWITTSYLITSTSFQPLYGAFSDVLGRRKCYFFATIVFTIGCIGCSLAIDIYTLCLARAITGIGGGGLITLSTVINSDLIPAAKRGLFQGFQNILIGIGGVLGASIGAFISELFGWKFIFLIQVPISSIGLIFGYLYIKDQEELKESQKGIKDIDFQGSLLLVTGLTLQLLSLYTRKYVSYSLALISVAVLVLFVKVEISTKRIPIIPFKKIHGLSSYLLLFISTLTGFSNFAYIFILPLLFQIVLGDTPSKAGLRLAIPSLFTSVGSLVTAYYMNKNLKNLNYLVHGGVLLLAVGNGLALLVSKQFPEKLINFLLIPANTGIGMSNPALLFSFVFLFPKSMQANSTSTLYLFRSIGNCLGGAFAGKIIQSILKVKLVENFNNDPDLDLSGDEISDIISKVIRSISYIKTLPDYIQVIVENSYKFSIRRAQLISTLIGLACFGLCLFRDLVIAKKKN